MSKYFPIGIDLRPRDVYHNTKVCSKRMGGIPRAFQLRSQISSNGGTKRIHRSENQRRKFDDSR